MRRFLTRFAVRLIIVLVLLVGAARVVGGFTPYPTWNVLAQFLCSPQPCWNDVYLGVTNLSEAATILSADTNIHLINYEPPHDSVCWIWQNEWHRDDARSDGCYTYTPDGHYELMLFYANRPLQLRDVMPLLRQPVYSLLCQTRLDANFGLLYSRDTLVQLTVPPSVNWITPELPVSHIMFFALGTRSLSDFRGKYGWWGYSEWANISRECGG
jgi:hypothetical protein